MIHICNNYISSKVHVNLIEGMVSDGFQYVFVPVRRKRDVGINDSLNNKVEVIYLKYPDFLKFFPLIKVFYIAILVTSAASKCSPGRKTKKDTVLAHNLWSDGVPALICSFFLKSKYALVVRNTDINFFIPKLLYARWVIHFLISKSEVLFFVSEAHKKRFSTRWPKLFSRAKTVKVVPNGIESFWIDNACHEDYAGEIPRPIKVGYVGKFDKNKNIKSLYEAITLINDSYLCELLLIGGSEDQFRKLCGITGQIPGWVRFGGWVSCREELAKLLGECRVFAMPSFRETFGLVYIEALSCGCSIVHSKNEGIDGLFDEEFVRGVNPHSVKDIVTQLDYLLNNFPNGVVRNDVLRVTEGFGWEEVSYTYIEALK